MPRLHSRLHLKLLPGTGQGWVLETNGNEVNLGTQQGDPALLSLSPGVNAGAGLSLATARNVVERVVSAKKGWNVEFGTFATFDSLPAQVQQDATKEYGAEDAKQAKGIVHKGKVYIIAENNGSEANVEMSILHEGEWYPSAVWLKGRLRYSGAQADLL